MNKTHTRVLFPSDSVLTTYRYLPASFGFLGLFAGGRSDNPAANSFGRFARMQSPAHSDNVCPSAFAWASNACHQSPGSVRFRRSLLIRSPSRTHAGIAQHIGRTVLLYTCRPHGAVFLSCRLGLGISDKPPAHSAVGWFRFLVSVACHHHIGQGFRPARPSAVYSVCRYCQIQIFTVVLSSLSILFWISSRLVRFVIFAMISAL